MVVQVNHFLQKVIGSLVPTRPPISPLTRFAVRMAASDDLVVLVAHADLDDVRAAGRRLPPVRADVRAELDLLHQVAAVLLEELQALAVLRRC